MSPNSGRSRTSKKKDGRRVAISRPSFTSTAGEFTHSPIFLMNLFKRTLQRICPVDPRWIESASRHQLELTKPPGSLGRLEEIANRCAAMRESFALTANRPRIVLFAADHGVCAEGISPYPQEVTAQMVLNFLRGGAAINALARTGGIELKVVDVGVATPLPISSDLISRRVASGTRNFCKEPAMTEA